MRGEEFKIALPVDFSGKPEAEGRGAGGGYPDEAALGVRYSILRIRNR